MRVAMAGFHGFSVGLIVSVVSPYNFMNWQWWAACLPLLVIANIYANTPREKPAP